MRFHATVHWRWASTRIILFMFSRSRVQPSRGDGMALAARLTLASFSRGRRLPPSLIDSGRQGLCGTREKCPVVRVGNGDQRRRALAPAKTLQPRNPVLGDDGVGEVARDGRVRD